MTDAPASPTPRRFGFLSEPLERNYLLLALALLAWCMLWMAAQTYLDRTHATPQHQVTVFMVASLAALVGLFLVARGRAYALFTSVPFAVTQMVFVAMSVLLGTLVLQELKWAEYKSLYGAKAWGALPLFLVRHAHVDDVYHSLWFYGLLLILSLSTLLVAWKRRPYPLPKFGFLLVHIAPTLILAGGLVGKYGFVRAFNEIHQGEPTNLFWRVKGPDPNDWKDAYSLPGFRVKLDKFEVQHYDPEYKLYAFVEPDGKGGFERNPKSYEVKEGLDTRLPLTWFHMKVDKALPDAVDNGAFQEDPKGEPNPVLKLMLGLGQPEPVAGYLLADSSTAYRFNEPGDRFAVLFKDHFDPALVTQLKPHGPTAEKLEMTFMGKTLEHAAKPGTTWSFPAFELKVVKLHNDFPFKKGPEGPVDLNRIPSYLRGPWLELKLHRLSDGVDAPLFLCARTPGFSDQANASVLPPGMGMSIHYVREGEEPQHRFVLYTQEDHKVRIIESGKVIQTADWAPGKLLEIEKGLSATVMEELPHAVWHSEFIPNPATKDKAPDPEQASPAIQVTLTDPDSGKTETHWLTAKNPDGSPSMGATFFDNRVGIAYHLKDAEAKDFRSLLVIEDNQGHELARKEVSVNDPLIFRGHWFYQSNYNPEDATVSGIMVVREPGLGLTYLGFLCLIFGSLWMFYLKPWLKKRAEGTKKGGAA